jgi:hypothetical protein
MSSSWKIMSASPAQIETIALGMGLKPRRFVAGVPSSPMIMSGNVITGASSPTLLVYSPGLASL